MTEPPILEVRNLEKYFGGDAGIIDTLLSRESEPIKAVDDVSLKIERNESQGIIGESGCGKSTLLKTLIGLHRPTGGEIYFKEDPISEFSASEWKEYRRNVQIIFQDPFNSLDPKLTIADSLKEPLHVHDIGEQDKRRQRVREMLSTVELNPPEQFMDRYPDQLSGGEKQRVSIARALILEPDVILADEPTSMLDVSTQAAILNLLSELTDDLGVSLVYISHDLSTVSYICDTVNVMYLGRIAESAPTMELLEDPLHPYTQALIDAIPIPDPYYERERSQLENSPKEPSGLGEGCRFRDRCPERMDVCETTPRFIKVDDERYTACHLHYEHDEMNTDDAVDEGVADD